MSNLKDLVPPLELCKLIPAGEFADSALCWVYQWYVCGVKPPEQLPTVDLRIRIIQTDAIPAPTFDEILDELHKCQEDVFVRWSETAYHGWLVNAYSHGRNEDYQVHDESKVTAALKLWLKKKGIEYEQEQG